MTSRTLFYLPIIHSQSEMGELGQSIMKITLRKLGMEAWQRKVDMVAQFWSGIEDIVFNELALPYSTTRVYQDALPVCDKELEIVTDIARMGSLNHQLLLRLKDAGATIMGTESPELLVEEYRLAKNVLGAGTVRQAIALEASQKTASEHILARRDAFIAARIADTLQEGETGILFLGMLHDPVSRFPKDMEVRYPVGYPEFAGPGVPKKP